MDDQPTEDRWAPLARRFVEGHCGSLRGRGVDPVAGYGVRLFTDGWTPARPAADPEDPVLEADLVASRLDPYRRLSRRSHLVGRRS